MKRFASVEGETETARGNADMANRGGRQGELTGSITSHPASVKNAIDQRLLNKIIVDNDLLHRITAPQYIAPTDRPATNRRWAPLWAVVSILYISLFLFFS